jgi:hypothetical protein
VKIVALAPIPSAREEEQLVLVSPVQLRRCPENLEQSGIIAGRMAEKRQDNDYRPPEDSFREMWPEYTLVVVVALAVAIVIYFVTEGVISLFQ